MALLPPVIAELGANITEFKAKMGEAKAEMDKVEAQGKSRFSGLAGAGKAALAGLAGAALGVGGVAIKEALAGEKSQAMLASAIKNAGVSYKSVQGVIEQTIKSQTKYGTSADVVRESLAKLTQATNDPRKAIALLTTAQNLSAARHIPLQTAVLQTSKVFSGSSAGLKRYGIDLGIAAGGTANVQKAQDKLTKAGFGVIAAQQEISKKHLTGAAAAMVLQKAHNMVAFAQAHLTEVQHAGAAGIDALNSKFGGAAAAQAGTYAGRLKAFEATVKNLLETLGQKLLPILASAGAALASFVGWISKHTIVAKALGVVLGVVVAALLAYKIGQLAGTVATVASTVAKVASSVASGVAAAATGAWTAAQWLLNAALDANPIGLIVLAIVALVAGVIEAYKHVTWFRDAVDDAWKVIKAGAKLFVDFFTGIVWPAIKAVAHFIGDVFSAVGHAASDTWHAITVAFDAVVSFISQLPGRIGRFFVGIWDGLTSGLSSAWRWVTGIFDSIVSLVAGIPGKIGRVISGVAEAILSPFKSAFNGIARLWNSTVGALSFTIPSWVPLVGGKGFSVPKIPTFATGVRNFAGGLALVGEKGPEVVSLPRGSNVYPHGSAGPAVGSGGGSVTNVFHISAGIGNPIEIGKAVDDVLGKFYKRNGRPGWAA